MYAPSGARRIPFILSRAAAGDLAPFSDSPVLRTVELQDIDGALLNELARLEARVGALAVPEIDQLARALRER